MEKGHITLPRTIFISEEWLQPRVFSMIEAWVDIVNQGVNQGDRFLIPCWPFIVDRIKKPVPLITLRRKDGSLAERLLVGVAAHPRETMAVDRQGRALFPQLDGTERQDNTEGGERHHHHPCHRGWHIRRNSKWHSKWHRERHSRRDSTNQSKGNGEDVFHRC